MREDPLADEARNPAQQNTDGHEVGPGVQGILSLLVCQGRSALL
jgi:hypothetical protein